MKRIFFIATLFGALFFQFNVASAQSDPPPAIHVSKATGNVGDVVDVTVSLTNNPGIVIMQLSVAYEKSVLKLVGVTDAGKLGIASHSTNAQDLAKNPYLLTWINALSLTDFYSEGVIATLHFEILAVTDNSPITVSYSPGNIRNKSNKMISFGVFNGSVSTLNEEEKPTIYVSNAIGSVGDVVDVTISLENNPGIVTMLLNVTYEKSVLKLVGVTDAEKLGTATHPTKPEELAKNPPYPLSWINALSNIDFESNGVIATLHFEILAEADNSPITVTYLPNNIMNKSNERISFEVVNGSVTATVYDPTQDNADITAVKLLVEGATYSDTQANIPTEAAAKAKVESVISGLALNGVTPTVEGIKFTPAIAGTVANISGTDGSYTFTVKLNKGAGTEQTTGTLTLTIIATAIQTCKMGDINCDGQVDSIDLNILISNYGKSGDQISDPRADLNNDGQVDSIDLNLLISNYGK